MVDVDVDVKRFIDESNLNVTQLPMIQKCQQSLKRIPFVQWMILGMQMLKNLMETRVLSRS